MIVGLAHVDARCPSRRSPAPWPQTPGCVLTPVPTAVPPSGTSASSSLTLPEAAHATYSSGRRSPKTTCPMRIGVRVLKMRPRPVLMTPRAPLVSRRARRPKRLDARAPRSLADGQEHGDVKGGGDHVVRRLPEVDVIVRVNLLLPRPPPRISAARFAITSLAFMFVEVPEPVWNRRSGSGRRACRRRLPGRLSAIACAGSSSSMPKSRLTCAAAALSQADRADHPPGDADPADRGS